MPKPVTPQKTDHISKMPVSILLSQLKYAQQKRAKSAIRLCMRKNPATIQTNQNNYPTDFFDTCPIGLIILEPHQNILRANKQACELLKSNNDLIMGSDLRDKINPSDISIYNQHLEDTLNLSSAATCQVRLINDKDERFICLHSVTISNNPDNGQQILMAILDITEQKKVENTLKELNEFNSGLLEMSPVAISVRNTDTSIRYVNPALEKLLGYSRSELIGRKTPYPFWPQDNLEEYQKSFSEIRTRDNNKSEILFVTKDGTPKWVELSSVTLREGKNIEYAIINYIDITARKKAELALRELNEFNTNLLEKSPHGIVVWEPDTTIRYVNSAVEKLTGFKREEVIGRKAPYPWWQRNDNSSMTRKLKQAAEEGQEIKVSEKQYRARNGNSFWVEISVNPVKFDGQTIYCVTNMVDITERIKLHNEMEFYLKEVTRIQEEERKRISRELHDDTAQSLACLALELDALTHGKEPSIEKIFGKLSVLKKQVDNSLREVRRFSHELRPGVLDSLGLTSAIELMIDEMNARNQVWIELQTYGEERRLSNEEELSFFRIVQEALNNVRKHSQATQATVRIKYLKKRIKIVIKDNGKGFQPGTVNDAISRGRLGLIGMRERAHLINATLTINSICGKGTTILLEN